MSADNYPSIFSRQMLAIAYLQLTTKFSLISPQIDPISPLCPSEENTRMDSTRPWKFFFKQAGL